MRRARWELSADRRTLTMRRITPDGIQETTLGKADPITPDELATLLAAEIPHDLRPGQRNTHRRIRLPGNNTLFLSVMLGPPTWWLPKAAREDDGAVMVGWLRLAVAVHVKRGWSG